MDGAELYQELMRLDRQLTASIKALKANGVKAAQSESDYQVAKATEALLLKDSGMSVGLIDLTVRGRRNVAEKRLQRDIDKVTYQANLEHINAVKLQIRVLDAQIEREWGQAKHE